MAKTTFDFSGQVAVVTGGARGIGKGSAEAFAQAGARVYVIDLDDAAGQTVVKSIREQGGHGSFLACDVTDSGRVGTVFGRIVAEAGWLDILVNSAGGFKVVDLNLKSVFLCAKAGVHSLTRVLAFELGKHGVTANAIAPGTTATERVVAVRSPEQREMIGKGTLVGWVLFLCSPEAGYLTGQTLAVNGGRLMV